MDKPPYIEAMLKKHTPTLTKKERTLLWNELLNKLTPPAPIPSPYPFTFLKTKSLSALILIMVLILGGSGTTYAANAARPGDTLFPLERALENTRLRLAWSDTSRNALRAQLAHERLSELREILDEASRTHAASALTNTQSEMNPVIEGALTRIEADIFTDRTTIKLEQGDTARFLETEATTTEGIIAFLIAQTNETRDNVIRILSIEEEDRASRPKDRGVALDTKNEARVETAIDAVFTFIDDSKFDTDARTDLLTSALQEVDTLDVRADGARRRIEDAGIHIEKKGGKKRIVVPGDAGTEHAKEKGEEISPSPEGVSNQQSDDQDDERSEETQASGEGMDDENEQEHSGSDDTSDDRKERDGN